MPKWLGKAPPADSCPGPVGVELITQNHKVIARNETRTEQVFSPKYDQEEIAMMKDVLNPIGTGAAAAIPGVTAWGKTGTTSNYADAWFVGSTAASGSVPSMTVAVWVGYPNSDKSMAKDFGGKPVYGGTYPALIWRAYVLDAIAQYKREAAELAAEHQHKTIPSSSTGPTGASGALTGATSATSATGAAATSTSATGATTPATGTVTSGGGSKAPSTTSPAGTSTTPSSGSTSTAGGASSPTSGSTTPTGGSTSQTGGSPPVTTPTGGVAAPGGGTTAPTN
jgi:penicillin-binding protein 1A